MTAHEVAARYAQAVDSRDRAALAALFTADAVVVLDEAMRQPDQPAEFQGRDAIADGVLSGVMGLIQTRHEICGQTTRAVGQELRTETYCQAHHIFERKGVPTDEVMAMRYFDTLTEVDGEWLISRRELQLDFTWRQEVRLPTR